MAIYSPLFLFLLLLLTSNSSSQSTAQPNAGELDTLLTIKREWGDPPVLSSWSTSNWAGVTCDNNGQVTALSFQKFYIAKPIPASICSLKNVTYIDLSYNNLTGEFPKVFYGCSALRYLDLSNNEFAGSLPGDINKLSLDMEHLNLSSNGFIGTVPSAIAGFPKLKSLVLDTNNFNGSYPAATIGGLVGLEMLTLATNPFVPGPVPEEFRKLTKLKTLWLSGMNLTGRIPDSLSALTELTLLDLSQNMLQGEIPMWVWKLQKLEKLYLYANKFTGGIGPDVTAVNMVELDMSMNNLTGPIPETIGNMKNLTLLFLYFNNITGPIPASVGLLPNLADIRLFNNRLSGSLPPELGKHSPLANLVLCNNLLSGELPETLCFNKKLFDIVVNNNGFSGVFPASLGECDTLNNIMAHNNRFVGDFPEKIWSFRMLTNVMIQNNSFTGTLPTEISLNISRIQMEDNKFFGAIPKSATKLSVFWAQNNSFSGALPEDMTGLANLTDLNLAGNRISGSIPPSIQALGRLNSLNLSSNQISGAIPSAIGSLLVLNILDLSNNALTGEIPPEFSNLHLSFLNLSFNQLAGEVPQSLQSPAYEGSFLRNPDLSATVNLHIIILFSVLACIALIGAAAIVCLIVWRQKQRQDLTTWKMTSFRALDFSERDILAKLRDENVMGSGGSGKVYRILLRGKGGAGMVVAVKRLWSTRKSDANLDKEFDSEVKILGDIRHINIVSLLCCISSEDTKLLVYEYMENGSLDRWLHHRECAGAPEPLDWPTRLAIAIDAARGLSYMHHECAQPIMHRDVKSSNILLDPGFRAKIADFGLARILVKSGEPESLSTVGGTFGYMAPEYWYRAKVVNEKVDVFSFGVVLLELVTGRVANDSGAECCLTEWAWQRYKVGGSLYDAVDEVIRDRAFMDDAVAVFMLGLTCIGEDPATRPSMKEVLNQLLRYDRTSSVTVGPMADQTAAPTAGQTAASKPMAATQTAGLMADQTTAPTAGQTAASTPTAATQAAGPMADQTAAPTAGQTAASKPTTATLAAGPMADQTAAPTAGQTAATQAAGPMADQTAAPTAGKTAASTPTATTQTAAQGKSLPHSGVVWSGDEEVLNQLLRYDCTSSVASACQDEYGHGALPLSEAKKGGQGKSLPHSGVVWSGDEEVLNQLLRYDRTSSMASACQDEYGHGALPLSEAKKGGQGKSLPHSGVVWSGDEEVLNQLLRYDRTSSVASACRDKYGHGALPLSEAKKGGQGKSLPHSGVVWSGDEEVLNQLLRYDRTSSVASACRGKYGHGALPLSEAKKGGQGKSLPHSGVVWSGDEEVLNQLLRYDRTSSVASACRDKYGLGPPPPPEQVKHVVWSSNDEASCSFVAHPVGTTSDLAQVTPQLAEDSSSSEDLT